MGWLELKIPPPLVAAVAALFAWLVARAVAPAGIVDPILLGAGSLVATAGLVVGALGLRSFRRAGTTFNPHQPDATSSLVESGIYRHTRNPMYLGLALVLAGGAIGLASATALVGPALFMAWITRFQIIPEERALTRKFGASFEAYRRRVRRWI